jgi:tripartite-type tricarboxylate transporter receptor subunit TctC
VAYLDKALAEIYAEGEIQKALKKAFFIPDFLPAKEAQADLKEKMDNYRKIIEAIR